MSADSLARPPPRPPVLRPTTPADKTLMDSVQGLINDVGLVSQGYGEEKENGIVWTRLESSVDGGSCDPLVLTIGYSQGVGVWSIGGSGEATEVFSCPRPAVRHFLLLPPPGGKDVFRAERPIAAIVDGAGTAVSFISLRTGETLRREKVIHPVSEVQASVSAVVASFLDKILIFDPRTLELVGSVVSAGPPTIAVALGPHWLAYSDSRLVPAYQSGGGMELAGTPSVTATVLCAAKSLSKGLKGFGESVASLAGHRGPVAPNQTPPDPGLVTVLNVGEIRGEFSLGGPGGQAGVVAHFLAHSTGPVVSMAFDRSGLLVVTADGEGRDFHVFRLHPHPLGASSAAVHHLYVLHRGDTAARVLNLSFSADSRWLTVSTLRGTTHLFPITPYGGPVNVRTHTAHRLVNRLSRFHRSAGLEEPGGSGRSSPPPRSPMDPFPNPRWPPYPHPVVLGPLAQLRQPCAAPARSSPPTGPKRKLGEERVQLVAIFEAPRGSAATNPSPLISPLCDRRNRAREALFVFSSRGTLVEYSFHASPASSVPKEKVSDDAGIEVSVQAEAEWLFPRPTFGRENWGFPPLGERSDGEGNEDRWLSHVEISTHSGPHRRLWMGPQFTFKVFSPPTTSALVEFETVELSVTNRPAKSNPVNMPLSSALLPVVFEGSSGSSLEQSPRFVDPYSSDPEHLSSETEIRESLADAMLDNPATRPSGRGSVGSCDDLSSSSFESTSGKSIDVAVRGSFGGLPFPD